jgi:hypothetical protein
MARTTHGRSYNRQAMKRILGPMLFTLLSTLPALAVDLRVMDGAGIEVVVKDISIDYGGLLGTDKEVDGIRVSRGAALETAKWTDIDTMTVTGRDATQKLMTIEIALRSGKRVNATLVRKGRMTLVGRSDLGDYSIDLEKIKKVTVVSAAPTKSSERD